MFTCTRRIEFDAAHRVIGHKNKCKFIHGHRYVLEVTVEADDLDTLGMVVDFGEIKSVIQGWVDTNLDHTLILHSDDKSIGEQIAAHTGQKIYYLLNNPTAENIALHLKTDIIPDLSFSNVLRVTKIRLYETPNCFVDV